MEGDPQSAGWCGHAWPPWASIPDAVAALPPRATGLYRLRRPDGASGLLYIGQGVMGLRLAAHTQKPNIPDHPQVAAFAGPLECSFVLDDAWHAHQRLELENDLIAAHVLVTGIVPRGQFIG